MTTYAFIEFKHEKGHDLIDMTGIENDLRAALQTIEQVEQVYQNQRTYDYVIMDALNTSILVRYRRAFTSGVRNRQSQRLRNDLSDELRPDHEYFLTMCNKHIAHSVNELESGLLHAHYQEESLETKGIQQISVAETRVVGMSLEDLSKLRALIEFFMTKVGEAIRGEKKRLLDVFRAVPIDTLKAWEEPASGVTVSPSTVGRSRRPK